MKIVYIKSFTAYLDYLHNLNVLYIHLREMIGEIKLN